MKRRRINRLSLRVAERISASTGLMALRYHNVGIFLACRRLGMCSNHSHPSQGRNGHEAAITAAAGEQRFTGRRTKTMTIMAKLAVIRLAVTGLAVTAAVLASAGAARPAGAQILIDDFSHGYFRKSVTAPNSIITPITIGHRILGGARETSLQLGPNPYGMTATIEVHKGYTDTPNSLVLGQGFGMQARIDEFYGSSATGTPLGANFLAHGADRIRVTFGAIYTPLNFNVVAFTGSAPAQAGCNIGASLVPTVVELLFSEFAGQSPGFTFRQVDDIDFIFQSANDWQVTRLETAVGGISGAQLCGVSAPPA
jgi:hypothetical protein